ncbi:MAG TPA: septal ring lytic transglycosylase RlpA family protein [Chitinophagales bacterium]|nr:septal ring lytic transglycosylase RlpA family protein [Chitinophagales bacterium]
MKLFKLLLFILTASTHTVQASDNFEGAASFYADKFEGRKTANGEIYIHNKFTCAHKTLPFGTKLKVTNLTNNKTVIVTVNDRGPYIGTRVIDLSKSAAQEIKMVNQGVARVAIQILRNDSDLFPKESFPIEEESLELSDLMNF